MKRTLIAAALCTGLVAGPAFAQTTGSISSNEMSTEEREMLDANPDWRGFYTDDTYSQSRTPDEVAANFSQLSEDRQDALLRDCERTYNNPGVWGEVTLGLCAQIVEM